MAAHPPRPAPPWQRTMTGRRRLAAAGVLVLASVAGYGVAFLAFPAPLVTGNHSVSPVFGLPQEEAVRELEKLGFKVKIEDAEADAVQPIGYVLWQDPVAYTVLEEGATVHLIPSAGPGSAPVPDVVGFDLDLAARTLATAGFHVGSIDTIAAGAEPGIVVATRPGGGAGMLPGAGVDVVVSRGPATIRVPDVLGLKEEDARNRLQAAGLRVGSIRSRTAPAGEDVTVLEQRPVGGILMSREGRVDLVVSRPTGERP